MSKEQLAEYYKQLDSMYNEYLSYERIYERGKKAQQRQDALRNMEIVLNRCERYIRGNYDLYNLITGVDNKDAYSKTIIFEEFISIRYFSHDMSSILQKLKRLIES